MEIQPTFGQNSHCSICKLPDIDILNYGEIHCRKELAVHLFCLYFSSNLLQRGQDSAGICGFEFRDTRSLIKNSVKTQCCYCHKDSATTYCQYPKCNRVYHQVCGFKANVRFEYLGHFRSYCDLHNDIEDENIEYPKINGCWICLALGDHHPRGFVGETHDFADIERYYTRCDAKKCLYPMGKNFSDKKWSIQLCSCCVSYGLHTLCRPKYERENTITCEICLKVVNANQPNASRLVDRTVPEQEEVVIDLTDDDDQNNVLDENIHSDEDVSETLEEKRNRERADRPVQDEMRDFRISVWFRDYKPRKSNCKANLLSLPQ